MTECKDQCHKCNRRMCIEIEDNYHFSDETKRYMTSQRQFDHRRRYQESRTLLIDNDIIDAITNTEPTPEEQLQRCKDYYIMTSWWRMFGKHIGEKNE